MVAGRRGQKRSLLKVNEYFVLKPDAADDALSHKRPHFVVRRVADLEICRRLKKRSILNVCEHFSDKQSFEDAPLSQQRTQ